MPRAGPAGSESQLAESECATAIGKAETLTGDAGQCTHDTAALWLDSPSNVEASIEETGKDPLEDAF